MIRANGSVAMKRLTNNLHKLLFGSEAQPVPLATLNVVKARFEEQAAVKIRNCIPVRPTEEDAWEILGATAW